MVGMIVGTLVALSVCWVWISRKEISFPSLGGLLVGAVLVTASIWAHVQIQVSEKGFSADFTRLKAEIQQVREENQKLASQTLRLTDVAQTNAEVLRQLSSAATVRIAQDGFDRAAAMKSIETGLLDVGALRAELAAPPPM
jgi:hypothetical protein